MQRNNDNKYSSEDNAFVTKPSSENVLENLNATSSHANQNPTAKAMRSGQQHEFTYEIAGPTVGGMAPQVTPYNQYSITDSMSKTKISEGTPTTTTTTTTTKPVGASSTDSISKAGAKAAGAVGAVPAGATTAGGDLVNAAKNVVSHHGTPEDSLDSPHPHPITYMSGKATEVKSQTATTSTRSAAFVEPIHSTGLNNPVAPTHHHATQNVPKGEVVTAGVIGAASATIAAPPMNDTIKATPRFTSSEPSSHPPSQLSSNDGLPKMTANSTTSTATPAEEKHVHEHHGGIKDKVKNVFRRRPSAQAAAEAEAAAAAAAEAAKPKSYDSNLDRFEAIPESPYTSSGAPKADLHAAPGKPAVKLDARPTTTLNQGHNSRRHEASTSDLAMRKTSTTSSSSSVSSRPLSEKITAPVVGAAATVGAAAAGTAACMGNMAKDAKDAVVDSTNTSTYSSKSVPRTPYSTPVVNTTSTYAPATTLPAVERATAKTTSTTTDPSRPLTTKITAPVTGAAATVGAATAGTAAYMSNKAKDTMDAATGGNAHNSSSYTTTTTTGTTPTPTTYSKTTPTTATSSLGTTPVQVKSADKIAIPASYKGPIPKAGPGEEVVWVKTTTTTDYYDTDKRVDTNGDVVETHQNVLDPNSFQTEHDNVTTYVNDGHSGKHPQK